MKIIYKVLFFFCCILTSNLYSQNQSGTITYKGMINEKYVDSFVSDLKTKEDIPMHIKQKVVDMYRNAKPETFELKFKNGESYYQKIESLSNEEEYNIGSKAAMMPYYTKDTIIEINRFLGNIAHEPIEWEVSNETKVIGGYTCYKANAVERLYNRQGYYYNRDIIAWFTPDIPVNFGPQNYSGLPGLILQVKRKEFTLTATELNLNPVNNEIRIKKLDNNEKIITQSEAHGRIDQLEADRKKKAKGNR